MRRCTPSRDLRSFPRRAAPELGATSYSIASLVETSCADIGELAGGLRPEKISSAGDDSYYQDRHCSPLQDAIDQVTRKFEEAQREYHAVAPHSSEWHKWKGEMIAYANAVALLEGLRSRSVLVP